MKKKIYSLEELEKKIKTIRKNSKIVLCHGVFDVIHSGHIEYFKEAKSLGDILIVTLTTDEFVNKGSNRPFYGIQQRLNVVSALSFVDYVAESKDISALNVLSKLKPNFYIMGKDYNNLNDDISGKIFKEKKLLKNMVVN